MEIEELLKADEVFCSGTAVVISSVGSITHHTGERVVYGKEGEVGPMAAHLYERLTNIQMCKAEDEHGWVESAFSS